MERGPTCVGTGVPEGDETTRTTEVPLPSKPLDPDSGTSGFDLNHVSGRAF